MHLPRINVSKTKTYKRYGFLYPYPRVRVLLILFCVLFFGLLSTSNFVGSISVEAACWCENGTADGCRCTRSGTGPVGPINERGITLWCDTEYEANTYMSRVNPICGTAAETIPFCAYHAGGHCDVTCWGTEWTSQRGNVPDEDRVNFPWNKPITNYNGFNSDSTKCEGIVNNITICRDSVYCCGAESRCFGGELPYGSCEPQDSSVDPPDWCDTSGLPGVVPKEDPDYVACDETISNEFHTFRPYQKSPCDRVAHELALFCGNTLNLMDEFTIEKRHSETGVSYYLIDRDGTLAVSPYSCVDNGNGTETCTFVIDRDTAFFVELEDAFFPIMGNTELVRNRDLSDDELTDAQKVNEYVSWYLYGAKFNPVEYGVLDDSNLKEFYKQIIDYSGPLRKLISHRKQRDLIESESLDAYHSVHDDAQIRHNQFIGCVRNILGPPSTWGRIVACWHNSLHKKWIRIANYYENYPPKEDDDKYKEDDTFNFLKWMKDYKNWRGQLCITIFGPFHFCFNNPFKPDYMGNLFFTVPFSSTEDRVGLADVEDSNFIPMPPAGNPAVDVRIITENVIAEPAQLFFAHMQEASELADILQSTYVALGEDRVTPVTNVEPPEWCDVTEVRSNPGDNLFAERISGILDYTSEVDCVFSSILQPGLVEECNVAIMASLETTTETPKADEVWSRLVAGEKGTFQRFFPYIEEGAPIEAIMDIPASSPVRYESPLLDSVGNPATGRDVPELYFSHIGGVHQYFLKCIQTALRPRGFGEACISGSADMLPPPPTPPPPGSGYCSPEFIRAMEPRFTEQTAREASCICQVESGGNLEAFNNSCINPGGSADYSVGLFQINLHPRATFIPRCPGGFNEDRSLPLVPCIIINQSIVDQCVVNFQDVANLGRRNIQEAYELYSKGTANPSDDSWCPWSSAGPAYCNLCL